MKPARTATEALGTGCAAGTGATAAAPPGLMRALPRWRDAGLRLPMALVCDAWIVTDSEEGLQFPGRDCTHRALAVSGDAYHRWLRSWAQASDDRRASGRDTVATRLRLAPALALQRLMTGSRFLRTKPPPDWEATLSKDPVRFWRFVDRVLLDAARPLGDAFFLRLVEYAQADNVAEIGHHGDQWALAGLRAALKTRPGAPRPPARSEEGQSAELVKAETGEFRGYVTGPLPPRITRVGAVPLAYLAHPSLRVLFARAVAENGVWQSVDGQHAPLERRPLVLIDASVSEDGSWFVAAPGAPWGLISTVRASVGAAIVQALAAISVVAAHVRVRLTWTPWVAHRASGSDSIWRGEFSLEPVDLARFRTQPVLAAETVVREFPPVLTSLRRSISGAATGMPRPSRTPDSVVRILFGQVAAAGDPLCLVERTVQFEPCAPWRLVDVSFERHAHVTASARVGEPYAVAVAAGVRRCFDPGMLEAIAHDPALDMELES